MTLTEQDKEQREALYTLLKTDPRADTYVIPYRVMDIFVEFITADRKRVALAAKINGMLYAKNHFQYFCNEEQHEAINERIAQLKAQLKAQQEEV